MFKIDKNSIQNEIRFRINLRNIFLNNRII